MEKTQYSHAPSVIQNFPLRPLAPHVARDEEHAPDAPVHDHGDPDAKESESHIFSENKSQHDPAEPHGEKAHNHGKLGVARRA